MPRCSSCSAPLPAKSIICAYCGTRNDIDITPVHKEKRLPSVPSDRYCPDCAITLESIDIGNNTRFVVEKCPECYGLFFDNGELDQLLEDSVKSSYYIDHHKLHSLLQNPRHKDRVTYRHCPVCDQLMQRQVYKDRSGVIMDVCLQDGVWLDAGEFKQLQEWIALGGASNPNRQEIDRRVIMEERKKQKRAAHNHQANKGPKRTEPLPDPYFDFLSMFF